MLLLGCTEGADGRAFARKGARVTALAPHTAQLAPLRAQLATFGFDGHLVAGDPRRLPFMPGAFELVFWLEPRLGLEGLAVAAREARVVLTPGGRLWLGCFAATRLPVWAALRVLDQLRRGRRVRDALRWTFATLDLGAPCGYDQLSSALRAAGFSELEARLVPGSVRRPGWWVVFTARV